MAGIDLRRRDMVVHGSGSVTSTLRSIPSVSSVLNAELSCRPERRPIAGRGGANLYRDGSQGTARGLRVQNREMEDGGMALIH